MIVFYLLSLIISIVLAAILIPEVLVISYRKHLFDVPGACKAHNHSVPRLGGVTFYPVIVITSFFLIAVRYTCCSGEDISALSGIFSVGMYFFVGMTILFLAGISDDLVSVSYRYKLLVQIIAASMFPFSGLWINSLGGLFGIYDIHWSIGWPLTVFFVVYIINAINFIDGIDGLASGLSLIAFFVFSVMCTVSGFFHELILLGGITGVLLVFFFFNMFGSPVRHTKIFMGDTGSMTLGYVISFMILRFMHSGPDFSPWESGCSIIALSTVLLPLLDVIRIVISRILSHRNPFLPDLNHIYDKMVRAGLNRTQAMLVSLFFSIIFIAVSLLYAFRQDISFILVIDIAVWILVNIAVNFFIRRREHTSGSIFHIPYNPPVREK